MVASLGDDLRFALNSTPGCGVIMVSVPIEGSEILRVQHRRPVLLGSPSRGADSRPHYKILNGSREAKGMSIWIWHKQPTESGDLALFQDKVRLGSMREQNTEFLIQSGQ